MGVPARNTHEMENAIKLYFQDSTAKQESVFHYEKIFLDGVCNLKCSILEWRDPCLQCMLSWSDHKWGIVFKRCHVKNLRLWNQTVLSSKYDTYFLAVWLWKRSLTSLSPVLSGWKKDRKRWQSWVPKGNQQVCVNFSSSGSGCLWANFLVTLSRLVNTWNIPKAGECVAGMPLKECWLVGEEVKFKPVISSADVYSEVLFASEVRWESSQRSTIS